MTIPAKGDPIKIWDYDLEEYSTKRYVINEVIGHGIYGVLVELENLRVIEVVEVPGEPFFRELLPTERRAKYKGHTTEP